MNKAEYFGKVIKVVTELMECLRTQSSEGQGQEVVDARWMVICLMREKGYPTRQISELVHHPERTVNHAISNMDDRIKYSYNGIGNIGLGNSDPTQE